MDIEHTEKVKNLLKKVNDFLEEHIYPIESEVNAFNANQNNYWKLHPKITESKFVLIEFSRLAFY